MTGGQEFDGPLSPAIISRQIAAEGVGPIIVVTDEPEKYPSDYAWAEGVTVRHRSELMDVQRELRDMPGVSAMIYDQTCASEKRRRRALIAQGDAVRHSDIRHGRFDGLLRLFQRIPVFQVKRYGYRRELIQTRLQQRAGAHMNLRDRRQLDHAVGRTGIGGGRAAVGRRR